MAKDVVLKVMKCPTCGANLQVENDKEPIMCLYCENTIIPVSEAAPVAQNIVNNIGMGGIIKIDGIKTSSSALAYLDQFFEEYDWEAFAYAQSLSITEIDKLTDSLKVSSSDDKNTWIVCFKAISVPFIHKIEGCKQILSEVIDEYKLDSLEAYSKFDAYKRISVMISAHKKAVFSSLEKIVVNAEKYGASPSEISELKAAINNISNTVDINEHTDIESIPEIKAFNEEKNSKIASALAEKGIDAESEYTRAKALLGNNKHVQALNVLLSLNGYSDSHTLINKVDKYFRISDIVEIDGVLYKYEKENIENNTYRLCATENGKTTKKAIVKNIKNIVTNHANLLYYLDAQSYLRKFNFSTKTDEKIYNKRIVNKSELFNYDRKIFLQAYSTQQGHDLIELDLISEKIRVVVSSMSSVIAHDEGKVAYLVRRNDQQYTNIIDIDTYTTTPLGTKNLTIEGFINNCVLYTIKTPNNYNKDLYIKALGSNDPEKLIEKNIFNFCDAIANKLFYFVGNAKKQSLISINCDGTERKEFLLHVSDVLFEQGGWVYFIRKSGYNSILCKSRLDGSKYSIIASNIKEFIKIKNGYLYYIDNSSALIKVRMDGSNMQMLCQDVETVLSVKEDKIIFVSADGKYTFGDYSITTTTTKLVKSIYAIDFSGSGKIKLAYDVVAAKEYDDNTVYYISEKESSSTDYQNKSKTEVLYKLDIETNEIQTLLTINNTPESPSNLGFLIMMVIVAFSFFLSFVGFASSLLGLGLFGLFTGMFSLIIGMALKPVKKE